MIPQFKSGDWVILGRHTECVAGEGLWNWVSDMEQFVGHRVQLVKCWSAVGRKIPCWEVTSNPWCWMEECLTPSFSEESPILRAYADRDARQQSQAQLKLDRLRRAAGVDVYANHRNKLVAMGIEPALNPRE